jgi:two-component system, OmpR family, response regulator
MTKIRVLVVDDEPNIRDLLSTSLRFAGFEVTAVANGALAIQAAEAKEPDIILLDVMLPDMNGFSVTKKLRSMDILCPILFLTARDETEDKVTGLTVGGDDYLTKPFSLDEVVARIQAILRRTKSTHQESADIDGGSILIKQDAHEVFVEGTLVDLSPTEYKLLRFLVLNADRVLTKAQILDHVWEYDFNGDMGIVESYVSYLRKKIDPVSSKPLIQTKRGVGYIYKSAN